MLRITERGEHIAVALPRFDLAQTLDCGQCFRFNPQPDGSFLGVAKGRLLQVGQIGDQLIFYRTTRDEFDAVWADYFDLQTDYVSMIQAFSADAVLYDACCYAGGIRLLRQDFFEVLCSFILSQNNNIPRIKGIIARLCARFGQPLGQGQYAFPTPETLADCSLEDFAELRAGFRDKYLLDGAQKAASGAVRPEELTVLPLDQARQRLMQIRGVGAKVADCILLYGCHRLDAFPVDVWMKRALERYYPHGFPSCFAQTAGVAQQFLFHYIRTCPQIQP